jgi:hypothetical protein
VEGYLGAFIQHFNFGKISKAEFWTRQVSQNARGPTQFVLDVPNPPIEVGFVLWLAVRVVETADINACLQQRFEDRPVIASRTDGCYDSRSSHAHPPHL